MTVLIAPDSFKDTHTAAQVADCGHRSRRAFRGPVSGRRRRRRRPRRPTLPLRLRPVTARARNPWGIPNRCTYGLPSDSTAVIELASASSLTAAHDGHRHPALATTYDTGMLIADAVRHGAQRVVVAAAGTATTDGGRGAIAAVESGGGLRGATITVLTDMTTRCLDAARVFGPQKGAAPATIDLLTRRLEETAGRLPRDPSSVDGSGAAGGFAGAYAAWRTEVVYIIEHATAVTTGNQRVHRLHTWFSDDPPADRVFAKNSR